VKHVHIDSGHSLFALTRTLALIPLFAVALGLNCRAENFGTMTTCRLQSSAYVLRRISAMSRNGVPDAILNNAKCLVVIPSAIRKERKIEALGVLTCRQENTWTAPESVKFEGSGIRVRSVDLLIFLMNTEAVQALRAGAFRIERQDSAPAPVVKTDPIPKIESHTLAVTYELTQALLPGSEVAGTLRASSNTSNNEKDSSLERISRRYILAVTSFVNTITPTGIVLHHTAIIPGQEKPPRSEHAIDRYHEERGFEILCSGRLYHVAYHYLIMANGTIKTGRPERCEGAHASGYNSYLGISVVGDFSSRDNPVGARGPEKPTRAQIASLVRLCRRLRVRYKIPVQNVVRHSDIANTECPGDRFPYRAILDQLKYKPSNGMSQH